MVEDTTAPVVALRLLAGDQEYVVAPVALRVAEVPEQIVLLTGLTDTKGRALTATLTVAVFLQALASVPVTV